MRTTDFLTHEGDTLVVAHSIHEYMGRYEAIQRATLLPAEMFVVSFMASIPLPRYRRREGNEQRWAGMDAGALRCPLFWIPERIGLRYPVFTEDGERQENDDEWALRIALHLVLSGLYDQETGKWVDVPGALGYYLDDRGVLNRFQAWLDGAHDDELDALDASPLFVMPQIDGDPDVYAWQTAQGTIGQLREVAADSHYREVLGFIGDAGELAERRELSLEQLQDHVSLSVTYAKLATSQLGDKVVEEVLDEAEQNIQVCETTDALFGFAVAELVELLVELQEANSSKADQTIRLAQRVIAAAESEVVAAGSGGDESGRAQLRTV